MGIYNKQYGLTLWTNGEEGFKRINLNLPPMTRAEAEKALSMAKPNPGETLAVYNMESE